MDVVDRTSRVMEDKRLHPILTTDLRVYFFVLHPKNKTMLCSASVIVR
jgi:hypothetical protein